jgi:PAS domain S-box-containing protein
MKKMQNLIIKISTRFINIAGDEVNFWIDTALQELGEFCQVDRSYVFLLTPDKKFMSNTNEWCRETIKPQISRLKDLQTSRFSWWLTQLNRKLPIVLNSLDELPHEAQHEAEEFRIEEIKSLLAVPMIYNKTCVGFLGFDAVKAPHKWSDDEIALLKMVADILTNAIERKKTEENLSETESLYRLFINTINAGIVISQQDRFLYVNKKMADMLGYTESELIGKDYREVYTSRGLDLLEERRRMRQVGKIPPDRYETTFKCKDGHIIDVEISPVITDYRGALATFAVINDISEYKRMSLDQQAMQVKLLKQQRLLSLTLMMSGIIHNIKNTLTVIMGRAQLLKLRLPQLNEPDIIVSNVKKIESLLTSFIDKIYLEQENRKIQINLSDLLKNELLFLETESFFKAQIRKELLLTRDLPLVTGYYSDFSQGLMSIVQCCVESMRDSAAKTLTIRTDATERVVVVEIASTGQPIIEGKVEEIFMPMFYRIIPGATEPSDPAALTKFNLYNAYMLLNSYGVSISASNNPAGGTTFRVEFPFDRHN